MAVNFNFKGTQQVGYKVSDIERLYAETVSNYIEAGYRLSLNGCSTGYQSGEVNHTDLTDGKRIMRIVITEDMTVPDNPEEWYISEVKFWSLKILKYEGGYGRETLWNNKGTELSSLDFYNIGRDDYDTRHMFFVRDYGLCKDIRRLGRDRKYGTRPSGIIPLPASSWEKLLKFVRRERGFKRVSVSDVITAYRDQDSYCVVFNFKGQRYVKGIRFGKAR